MSRGWMSAPLVGAAMSGDVESLTELVAGAHPHVLRFANSLCSSPQDAEDAAQEALVILYRKVGTLRSTAALASWMFRIVSNECLRRSRARWHLVPYSAEEVDDVVGSSEEEVIRRLEAERVAQAISALPEVQRRVLIMRDVQGYSGRMAADALGLSVPAMKSTLHRARQNLHRQLRPQSNPA